MFTYSAKGVDLFWWIILAAKYLGTMQYLVSDYYATGEGRTVCILVMNALPREGMSSKLVAAKEFLEVFGDFYIRCAENLCKDDFFKRYGRYLPTYVEKVLDSGAGMVYYTMKLSLNFG